MILLCGIPSESPLALVAEALRAQGADFLLLNQRRTCTTHLSFEVNAGIVTGLLEYEGATYPLENFTGIYTRLMDHRMLPEVADEPTDSPIRQHLARFHDILLRWLEIAPARVVNRFTPMGSNSSKPYQAQLIRAVGLRVPDSLISNDPKAIARYRETHGRVIYKSISGVRSIVQTFGDEDMTRLPQVRWCPTQFQRYIPGTDVRVHVVGEEVFATAIESNATDYRYAQSQTGKSAELRAVELSSELAAICVRLAAHLRLAFTGIDLKITPENEVYCFEANPCPGYSYYEHNTGQLISHAVARFLRTGNSKVDVANQSSRIALSPGLTG